MINNQGINQAVQRQNQPPVSFWQKYRIILLVGGSILFILIGILIGRLISAKTLDKSQQKKYPQTTSTKKKDNKSSTKTRKSKVQGFIADVFMANELDSLSGKALNPKHDFWVNDKSIYAILGLNHPKSGTKIEYVRYLNGKYLDHKSLTLEKESVNFANFNWSISNPLASHLAGDYKLKFYSNGKFEVATEYKVTRNIGYIIKEFLNNLLRHASV